ncbi:C-GCAxxG-C-C family protein [Clostridium kluyveri]|uniref:Redox-active protein n=1 Tax=Clostridium kluyveri TaxID=1534 RepID=A0A1L5F4G4_CLOKL|nr:C-GCAxxG-C-C family protein [Clostridium kluyveri]APM37740.1 redox-active protein [Clostridium kluyveri]UZQ52234.1 C-GCAxxG-C-C family protein [Clostridium kluyveri]
MKSYQNIINERVHNYYWEDDINCATTVLKTLAEICEVDLNPQVIDSAIGMHGAGKFGAQCGLVEGSLMFIGIFGRKLEYKNEDIANYCYNFANGFQDSFGSIVCKDLRSQGFNSDDPPHICEEITKKAIEFTYNYVNRMKEN